MFSYWVGLCGGVFVWRGCSLMVRDTAHSTGDEENTTHCSVFVSEQYEKNNDVYKQVCGRSK